MATPENTDDHRNPIEAMMDAVVDGVVTNGGKVIVRREAERIVSELRASDPQALIDYFAAQAVSLLGNQLRVKLAYTRRRNTRSVFAADPATIKSPFDAELYPGLDHQWKRLGDLLRPDWRHIALLAHQQSYSAFRNAEFAKLMVEKLPDDHTPTRDVVSVAELDQLRDTAETRAWMTLGER